MFVNTDFDDLFFSYFHFLFRFRICLDLKKLIFQSLNRKLCILEKPERRFETRLISFILNILFCCKLKNFELHYLDKREYFRIGLLSTMPKKWNLKLISWYLREMLEK